MKANIYKSIIIILSIGLFSCSDFLDEEPRSAVSPDAFYSTENEANSAILGIYDILDAPDFHGVRGIWTFGDNAADLTRGGQSIVSKNDQQGTYNIDPGNNTLLDFYELNYNLIMRANTAINRIGQSTIDQEKANEFIAEAKYLRALAYFYLVRIFGDVVLVVDEPNEIENFARTPVDQVYELIVADLQEAETNLPDKLDMERASMWAAKALLAKIYLTMGRNEAAAQKSAEVINSGKFDLHPMYNEVFRPENNTLTEEILFAVSQGPARRSIIIDFLTPAQISAYGAVEAEDTLFNFSSYEDGDLRRDMTIYRDSVFYNGEWVELNDGNIYFLKFAEEHIIDGLPEGQSGFFNYPVLRYADVLLIHAEALNETNNGPTVDAYNSIDEVRARAGLPSLSQDKDYESFRETILQERKVEFVLEGQRWFDLKRMGKLQEVLSFYEEWRPLFEIFPIPEAAIIANDQLTQTDGY
ncbi:MAG: RagB/SusD family nutrient uptake outer membrane protein [Bacteroidota bacterium]